MATQRVALGALKTDKTPIRHAVDAVGSTFVESDVDEKAASVRRVRIWRVELVHDGKARRSIDLILQGRAALTGIEVQEVKSAVAVSQCLPIRRPKRCAHTIGPDMFHGTAVQQHAAPRAVRINQKQLIIGGIRDSAVAA